MKKGIYMLWFLLLGLIGCTKGPGSDISFVKVEGADHRFAIAQTEITFEQWKIICKWAMTNGYIFNSSGERGDLTLTVEDDRMTDKDIVFSPLPLPINVPVTSIDWYDAVRWCNALSEYCNKKPCYYLNKERTQIFRSEIRPKIYIASSNNGFRLPNTIEILHIFSKGRYMNHEKKYGYNDKFTVHPVGLKSCDVFGVYDLAGNVAEWLNDNGYFSSNNRKLTSITMENEGERHFINHLPAGVSGTGLGFRIVSKDVTNIHLNRSSFEFNPNILTGRYQLFENGKRTLGYLEIREEVLAVVSPSFEKVPVLLGFFDDKPHHFHIWYNNVICEGEGYFPSLYIQNKNTIIIYSNARYVFRYEEPVFSN